VNLKSDVLVSIFELELGDGRGPGEYGGLSQSSIQSVFISPAQIPMKMEIQISMKNEELDVPLKHSGTSYTSPAPIPRISSSASKCQSFTYSPAPFPDSHKSRTSPNGLSDLLNSPYSGVEVSATGTIWLPYFLRAFSFGFDGPPLDAVVHSVRDGQWAVDEEDSRKGVLGRRCCDCHKSGCYDESWCE
jgi:hypothetical protein